MLKRNYFFIIICIGLFSGLSACKKTETGKLPATPIISAGTNQTDVSAFVVKLNGDSLKKNQIGKWTIVSGLTEPDKVYFEDENKPDTRFHGLPGETYVLKWWINTNASTVTVSFKPLQTSIINTSPNNKTQFYLSATGYDSGEWTIDGAYGYISNTVFGGTYVAPINAPNLKFQGYANRNYKLTWTTKYGSKTASASITITTGNYLESEALSDLQLDAGSNRLTYSGGHITELNLYSSGIAWILSDTVGHPAVQALSYLKRLDLSGSSVIDFPVVIGDSYKQLEYLDMTATRVSSIPSNFGQLKKLKYLYITNFLADTKITSLPSTFGLLESLETFVLRGGLTSLPSSFGQLKKLRYCDLWSSNVQSVPSSIGDCSDLEHLVLGIQANIPSTISKLTKLRYLSLGSGGTITFPSDIDNMVSLDTLVLNASVSTLPPAFMNLSIRKLEIQGGGLASLPSNFGSFPRLDYLFLNGSFTTLPASITSLGSLKYLQLNTRNLTVLPADIGNLKKLQVLIVSNNKISSLPASIGDLPELKELWLGQNQLTTLPANFFSLPKIMILDLANNQLTSLPSDFQNFKNSLKTLYLQGNSFPASDLIKIKQLLPNTGVTPYSL